MKHTMTIAFRELNSLFRLPAGWVVLALYVFLCAVVFAVSCLTPGQPATLRPFFVLSGWLLLPVIPAVSMRLLSEELRSGTIESLVTAPVTDVAVIVGKFVGAGLFLLTMLVPTVVFPVVLFLVSSPAPDIGPVLAGYASLILQGLLYLAIGVVASSLTSNQTLAFLATLFAIMTVLVISQMAVAYVPTEWIRYVQPLLVGPRVLDFAKGIVDTSHVVFFLTLSAWFLLVGIVILHSRRWR